MRSSAFLSLALLLVATPATAVLDINDRGPMLRGGSFALRVTNAGILGNAFPERCNDPSLEYPAGSGQELLKYAALWVGARDERDHARVSGGPLLEWRPAPGPEAHVREVWHGALGAKPMTDDDNDGAVDEERLNGKDDDNDGDIDEDLGVFGQQMMAAEYSDDRPEAVNFAYGSERHEPLGLEVYQTVQAWAWPGFQGIAGLQFFIRNHGTRVLRDVYLGLLVDMDVVPPGDRSGYLDDEVTTTRYDHTVPRGIALTVTNQPSIKFCSSRYQGAPPTVRDANRHELPVVGAIGLGHTTDPLGLILPPRFADRAIVPTTTSFRYQVFSASRPTGDGGLPISDQDRYSALAGDYPVTPTTQAGDPLVLISCGPFKQLAPGQTLSFEAALVVAGDADSLSSQMGSAGYVHDGVWGNVVPDSVGGSADRWFVGRSGINGHEACIDVPEGVSFFHDAHCSAKFGSDVAEPPVAIPTLYEHGKCIWTDADCDLCTGISGNETHFLWSAPGVLPPTPRRRVAAGDHEARIEWDNSVEILIETGQAGAPRSRFLGYRVYKLVDWRNRRTLMPTRDSWAMIAGFGADTTSGEVALASVTDTTLAYERILYRRPLYPVGRYAYVDHDVLNGFDVAYMVSAVVQTPVYYPRTCRDPTGLIAFECGFDRLFEFENPLVVDFKEVVRPPSAAKEFAGGVWVVPNPFRARADWDKPAVLADPFTRHLDFMGLPRALCKIKIWTVAGDLVADIIHDASTGNGQAAWNLISRNGQEVESGIYVFTVESSLGRQTGKFVVIR